VALFFGDAYSPAGDLTRALSIAFFLVAIRSVTIIGLRGLGDGRGGAVAELIALLVFAVACIPLTRRWGPYGLALAVGAASLPALAYLAAHVRRRHGLSATSLWGLRPSTARDCINVTRSLWTR
jgi:O-antigen/teichoic acid export membrane protein